MKEIKLDEHFFLIENCDYKGVKFPQNLKAYYLVMEKFKIPNKDNSSSNYTRFLMFDEGTLLERRSDALNYCSHRINEIEQRVYENNPSIEEEKGAYKFPDEGWTPLPDNIEEFGDVLIECTLIIALDDVARCGIPILSTNPVNFTLFGLVHEADYLRDNV